MKRRKFLTLAGIGGIVLALPSFKFISTSFEEAAAQLIQNELKFLTLDKTGLEQFVKDFSRYKDKSYKLSVRGYAMIGIKSTQSGKINQLISNYLLSTDFFDNNMDESRTVRYVGVFDPYRRPCAHPFSHLRNPEAT